MILLLFVAPLWHLLQEILRRAIIACSAVVVVLAVLHRCGVLLRLAHRTAERELSKELNGCRTTIGRFRVDLRTGRVEVRDLVVHSPRRDEWEWDAPLLARAASIEASLDLVSFLDASTLPRAPIAAWLGHTCREVRWVRIDGAQIFAERRRNVFNFHLLDASLHLPDPPRRRCAPRRRASPSRRAPLATVLSFEEAPDAAAAAAAPRDPSAEAKANEIVDSVLGAVSSLGRAVHEGGTEGLEKALGLHKEGVLARLKQFQRARRRGSVEPSRDGDDAVTAARSVVADGDDAASSVAPSSDDHAAAATVQTLAMEGMKVMKQMGKAVNRNVSEIQEQIDSYKKPPPKKKGWVRKESKDLFRIGWISISNVHVFTKNMIVTSDHEPSSSSSSFACDEHDDDLRDDHDNDDAPVSTTAVTTTTETGERPPNAAGWSPPILLKSIAVSGADLCPRATQSIGLKIEELQDVVVQKTLAELAKSGAGKMLRTVLGDVFALMELKGNAAAAVGSGGGAGRPPTKRE